MSPVKYLEWDSAFFGFPVASIAYNSDIEIERELFELRNIGIKLVYVFVPEQSGLLEPQLLEKFRGILADRKITFKTQLNNDLTFTQDMGIEMNKYLKINDSLTNLALLAGKYSRFKTDPNISEYQFKALYTEWIKNSISDRNDDIVITHHFNKKVDGLVTLSFISNTGRIGLISVSDKSQNMGVGKLLIHSVFDLCLIRKIRDVEVVTQSENQNACNFYRKIGFKEHQVQFVYHFWLNTK